MKAQTCILALLAILGGVAHARKTYLVKQEHQGRIPQLRQSGYPSYTLYENFDDEITIYYQGKLAVAYQFDQSMDEDQDSYPDVYHLTFDLIFRQSLYFSPLISIPKLIYLEPELEVQEFDLGFRFDMVKFWEYPDRNDILCFSSYINRSAFTILATLVMRFQECYSTIINCIYNLDNWTSEDAKIFESCSQSSKTTITMYERDFASGIFGNFLGSDDDDVLRAAGQADDTSICRPGRGWRLPIIGAGDLTHSATFISNLWHYVAAKTNYVPQEFTLIDVSHLKSDDM